MERLTFEGNFCDIAQCAEIPGGSFCEDGDCSQKKVWQRLKEYEDAFPYERMKELMLADREGRLKVLPRSKDNTCGSCLHFQRFPGSMEGKCDLRDHYLKRGRLCTEGREFIPTQSRTCCKKYAKREAAENGKIG